MFRLGGSVVPSTAAWCSFLLVQCFGVHMFPICIMYRHSKCFGGTLMTCKHVVTLSQGSKKAALVTGVFDSTWGAW